MSSGLYNTHKIDFDTTLDLTRLKPYGDTMNDGKVQTSFTLPIKDDERGEEAARQIAKKTHIFPLLSSGIRLQVLRLLLHCLSHTSSRPPYPSISPKQSSYHRKNSGTSSLQNPHTVSPDTS